MDDVRGDILGSPHGGGTTPAAVIANINKIEILFRAVNILMRKGMSHTAVSAT